MRLGGADSIFLPVPNYVAFFQISGARILNILEARATALFGRKRDIGYGGQIENIGNYSPIGILYLTTVTNATLSTEECGCTSLQHSKKFLNTDIADLKEGFIL